MSKDEFQVGDIVCVIKDQSVHPFPTGYISKITKNGNFWVIFEGEGGQIAQPHKAKNLSHREISKGEMVGPSGYRKKKDGTLIHIK